jgi:hypothetical protein
MKHKSKFVPLRVPAKTSMKQCRRCNEFYQGTRQSKFCTSCYHPSGKGKKK